MLASWHQAWRNRRGPIRPVSNAWAVPQKEACRTSSHFDGRQHEADHVILQTDIGLALCQKHGGLKVMELFSSGLILFRTVDFKSKWHFHQPRLNCKAANVHGANELIGVRQSVSEKSGATSIMKLMLPLVEAIKHFQVDDLWVLQAVRNYGIKVTNIPRGECGRCPCFTRQTE